MHGDGFRKPYWQILAANIYGYCLELRNRVTFDKFPVFGKYLKCDRI